MVKIGIYKKCPTCGAEFYVKPSHIKRRHFCSKKCMRHSEDTKEKIRSSMKGNVPWNKGKKFPSQSLFMSLNNPMKNPEIRNKVGLRGPKHPNWKGGRYLDSREGKSRPEWHSIRLQVYKIFNYACANCGITNVPLDVHHIIPWRVSRNDNLDNLIALCRSCHMKIENNDEITEGARW